MSVLVLLTADIWLSRRRSTTAAWRDDASAGCPTPLTMAAIASSHAALIVLNRNRAITLWENRRVVSRASRHAKLR